MSQNPLCAFEHMQLTHWYIGYLKNRFEQNLEICSIPLEGAQGYYIISALSIYIYSHMAPSTLVSTVNEILKPALQKNQIAHICIDSANSESDIKWDLAFWSEYPICYELSFACGRCFVKVLALMLFLWIQWRSHPRYSFLANTILSKKKINKKKLM